MTMFAGLPAQLPAHGNFMRKHPIGKLLEDDEHEIPPMTSLALASSVSRGGKMLGAGNFGLTLPCPQPDRVRKMNHRVIDKDTTDGWLLWAEACRAAPPGNPYLPVVHSLRKASGLGGSTNYDAEIERLTPVRGSGSDEYDPTGMRGAVEDFGEYLTRALNCLPSRHVFVGDGLIIRGKARTALIEAKEDGCGPAQWLADKRHLTDTLLMVWRLIGTKKGAWDVLSPDLHSANIMLRRIAEGSGPECYQPVLTDPVY